MAVLIYDVSASDEFDTVGHKIDDEKNVWIPLVFFHTNWHIENNWVEILFISWVKNWIQKCVKLFIVLRMSQCT